MQSFDVVIVGGGMVGGALACALGLQGIRLAVIEARQPQMDWPAEIIDLRVSAITRASQQILTDIGAWSRIAAIRISPYRNMQVWDATGTGSIHFDSAEIGEPNLGHIIENRVIQRAIWERLVQLPSVHLLCPAQVEQLRLQPTPQLTLADNETIDGKLIIAADGARSLVRNLAGITTQGWLYDQHAVVANVQTEKSHQETAWQRFLPTGPLAFLPLNDGRCSIVWSTSPAQAQQLVAMPEDQFCNELTQASEARLGAILATSERARFPLRLQHAQPYVLPGLALVGDAAHAIHPLAGQGVNLGLLDVATLAQVLFSARQQQKSLGSFAVLRRYERARKGENLGMMMAMDGFKRLFSNQLIPLQLLRNLGLNLTDRLTPLKRQIMHQALGQIEHLPLSDEWESVIG